MLALSTLVLLPACGVNEDNYVEKFAKVLCGLYDECYQEEFASYWDDVNQCVDELVDAMDEGGDYYADCTFDNKNAKDCIDSYKKVTCDDIEADTAEIDETACENIWEC